MTKIMKLNVTYNGYYGGDVDEILLLPLDINGVLFEGLKEKSYDRVIYLGEIEGKHSECYGDLEVDFVDLDKLSVKEVTNMVNESNFGEFESFFEGLESDFEEDEDEYDVEKVNEVLKLYNVEPKNYMIKTSYIHDEFIEQLKEKYIQKFKSITVLEENYNEVVKLLAENNIAHFE